MRVSDRPGASWSANFDVRDRAAQTNGVVTTVWFFDYENTRISENKPHELHAHVFGRAPGETKESDYTVEIRRYHRNWRPCIRPVVPGKLAFDYSEEAYWGWNRYDVVAPGTDRPDEPVRFYLNGRQVYETPVACSRLASVSTQYFTNHVGGVVQLDAARFRPNPVREISPAQAIALPPEAALPYRIDLDSAGFPGETGTLEVLLLNGAGETIAAATHEVHRTTAQVTGSFDKVPRCGVYVIETRFAAEGLPHPDRTRQPVDVTFVDSAVFPPEQLPRVLSQAPWQFLPNGPLEPLKGRLPERRPEARDFAIPEAVPTDWSAAEICTGLWHLDSYDDIGRPYYGAWLRQRVAVPTAWKDGRVRLDVTEPATRATAFVNGRRLETVEWPGGAIDVTAAIRFGEMNEIALYVTADPYFGLTRVTHEILGDTYRPNVPDVRGLAGPVTLLPVAAGAHVDGLAIRPTDGTAPIVEAVAELADLVPGTRYRFAGEVRACGKAVCTLPPTEFVATSAVANVSAAAPFPGVRRWEIYNPWLYDFTGRLQVADGKGWRTVSTPAPERFGFRTLDWHGSVLKVNGRTFTHFLKLDRPARMPDLAVQAKTWNFTSFYGACGTLNATDLDESGLSNDGRLIFGDPSLCFYELARVGKDQDPRFWLEAERFYRRNVRNLRNHPAIFGLRGVLGGNRVGNGSMYNPLYTSGSWTSRYPKDGGRVATFEGGQRLIAMQRALDPTRYITAQDAGSINDCRHITEYPGWTPMQEMIEKGLFWGAISTKPFLISEQAAPMFPNWTDACWQGKGWNGVPMYQEWSAPLIGDAAYDLEPFYTNAYARLDRNLASRRAKAVEKAKTDAERRDILLRERYGIDIPLVQQVWKKADGPMPLHCRLTRENTLTYGLFNRWHGVAMLSPGFTSGPARYEFERELFEPATGFLAGRADRITDATHLYTVGERLERGLAFVNNAWEPREVSWTWRLAVGGKTTERQGVARIPAGGRVFEPIAVDLTAAGAGELVATFAAHGETLREDRIPVDVLPAELPKKNFPSIALVDPELETMRDFQRLGIPFHYTVFDEDLVGYDLIVFGRRAFRYESATVPEGIDLGALVKAGRRILILEQDEETLRERFKFRTEYLSARKVFARGNFPFDDRWLANWRGAGTLTTGYEVAAKNPNPAGYQVSGANDGGEWMYLWNDGAIHPRPMKWGNSHVVATVAIHKPETGSFRTLADCGFDLRYDAALEYVAGDGRIVFNQMDVTARSAADPAADRVLLALLDHTANAPAVAPQEVLVLKGLTAAAAAEKRAEALRFAEAGGTVFSLLTDRAAVAAVAPEGTTVAAAKVRRTTIGKSADPLLAGLGDADFFWKGDIQVVTVNGGVLTEVPVGRGRFVFCAFDPSVFGDTEVDHWLKYSQDKAERVIRTLLTNCGQRQVRPRFLDVPKADFESAWTLDLRGTWQGVRTLDRYVAVRTELEKPAPGAGAAWKPVAVPSVLSAAYPDWDGPNGELWIRRTFTVAEALPAGSRLTLSVGNIAGEDVVWLNGRQVAVSDTETDVNTIAQKTRRYVVDGDVLRAGENEIAVRITWQNRAQLGLNGSTGAVSGRFELAAETPRAKGNVPKAIDLADCEWWGHAVDSADEKYQNGRRRRFRFPGAVQSQYKDYGTRNGYYWFSHEFTLAEPLPEDCQPALVLGAVDDEDWTYLNGQMIGHTGKDTNPHNYWAAKRVYPIDPKLFKVGKNFLTLKLNDLMLGASFTGPLQLVFEPPEVTAKRKLAERPYLRDVGRADDPYWHHGF